MPFVSNDLLHELGRELAALRRQVTDQQGIGGEVAALRQQVTAQQHAIDQIRQDATAAITTGLTEIRAVVRQGLEKTRESVSDPLVGISTELVAVRNGAQDSARRTDQAQEEAIQVLRELRADVLLLQQQLHQAEGPEEEEPSGQPGSFPDAADSDDEVAEFDGEFYGLLKKAAGISHATVTASRDTWAFLVEHAAGDRHFRVPGDVTACGGTVDVQLAGPSLVAAMTALRSVARNGADVGTRAIAEYLDDRLTQTVKALADSGPAAGGESVAIVIDDRLAPPAPAQPERDETESGP